MPKIDFMPMMRKKIGIKYEELCKATNKNPEIYAPYTPKQFRVFNDEVTFPNVISFSLKLMRLKNRKIAIMREIRPSILDIINDLRLSDLNIYILCNTIRFIYFEENY